MLMKVFSHGTGDGDRPVHYLIREDIPSRKEHPPEVLRGDPKLTAELINSIERRWKFTSGVLAWHPGDDVNEAQERDVMDAFERVAFAGLEADQRHILWVRHRHAGHHELHFLIPRMELSSGKDFNTCPPGWQKDFSFFRDLFNWREGWARPDDPARSRDFLPDKADLIHAQAVRWNRKIKSSNRDEMKATITELLKSKLAQGDIKSREDVLHILKEEGLHISRTGKDYIGVVVPESGLKIRLKGGIFSEAWKPKEQSPEEEVRFVKLGLPKRIASLEEELERVLEKRKRNNRKRYPARWSEQAENLEDRIINERNRTPAYRGAEKDGVGEPAKRQGFCQPSAPAGGSDASPESRSGRTAELLRRCWEAVRELAELIAQAEQRKRELEEDSFRMRM